MLVVGITEDQNDYRRFGWYINNQLKLTGPAKPGRVYNFER